MKMHTISPRGEKKLVQEEGNKVPQNAEREGQKTYLNYAEKM